MNKPPRRHPAEALQSQQIIYDTTVQPDGNSIPSVPMTTRQVADYLAVGEDVVRELFRSGRLRAFKAGGQWRTSPEDVSDYILKQLQKT